MPSLDELRKTAFNLHEEERKQAQIEHDLYQLRLELVRAKDDLDREISLVSLAAYNDGKIDGKNESQRKLQLESILSGDKGIRGLRKCVMDLEDNLGRIELQLGYQRAQVRFRRNTLEAAMATARTAGDETDMIIISPGQGEKLGDFIEDSEPVADDVPF
jgi:hypothetical protein